MRNEPDRLGPDYARPKFADEVLAIAGTRPLLSIGAAVFFSVLVAGIFTALFWRSPDLPVQELPSRAEKGSKLAEAPPEPATPPAKQQDVVPERPTASVKDQTSLPMPRNPAAGETREPAGTPAPVAPTASPAPSPTLAPIERPALDANANFRLLLGGVSGVKRAPAPAPASAPEPAAPPPATAQRPAPEQTESAPVIAKEVDERPRTKSSGATPTDCLPPALQSVLAGLQELFSGLIVVSTTHLHTDNHSPGSARARMHSACRAVDVKVGGDARAVLSYLRSREEVGGMNSYRNGVVHFDLKAGYRTRAAVR